MIKAWWIRRWYFLYISAFMILHIVALFKPLRQKQRHDTFDTYNIYFHMTLFYKGHIYTLYLHFG